MISSKLIELYNNHHRIFSFSLTFCSLNVLCLGVFYFLFILPNVLSFLVL